MKNPTRADRYNIYQAVHKALRAQMFDTLCCLGRLDVDDPAETTATLDELDALLRTMDGHVAHENTFIHTAIEARRPGGAETTAADHDGHVEHIAALQREVADLREACAAPARKAECQALAFGLYHAMALFVADNLQHMHIEETVNCAALWEHYTDAELREIEGRLVATVPPPEMLALARWMVPASTPSERAGMLKGMQATTPPEAFVGVLTHLRPHVDPSGWTKLAGALELGPALR